MQRAGQTSDQGFDETLVLRFADDGINKLQCTAIYDEKIVLLPVKEYRAERPPYFKRVVQAAYKLDCPDWYGTKIRITEYAQKVQDCELKISLECPKCKKVDCDHNHSIVSFDADRIWRAEHPEYELRFLDHFYGYFKLGDQHYGSRYHPEFRLMQPKQNNFFALKYHIKDCINFFTDCEVEYAVNDTHIIVPFRTGTILLSYLGERTDEEGYRMIPLNRWITEYIEREIESGLAYIDCRRTKGRGDCNFYQLADAKAKEAFSIAKSKLNIPEYHSFKQFWRNKMNKLIDYSPKEQFLNYGRFMPDKYRLPDETSGLIPDTSWR